MNTSDVTYTNRIGYTEAKLVCERVVHSPRNNFTTDIDAGSVRIGQMSGSEESGVWNTEKHIAAMLKLSVTNNALPALEATLSWLPVNVAASSISYLLVSKIPASRTTIGSSDHTEPRLLSPIYHLETPIRWRWDDVLSVLASLLPQESECQATKLPLVPYSTWLDRVVHLGDTIKSSNGDSLGQHDTVPID